MTRLETVDRDLVATLKAASPDSLRGAAQAAAALAVTSTGLIDKRGDAALLATCQSRWEKDVRQAVDVLAAELDEEYWRLDELHSSATSKPPLVMSAFAKARAAAAVSFLLDQDPLVSAMEASYEAQAAVGSIDAVRKAVLGVLQAAEV